MPIHTPVATLCLKFNSQMSLSGLSSIRGFKKMTKNDRQHISFHIEVSHKLLIWPKKDYNQRLAGAPWALFVHNSILCIVKAWEANMSLWRNVCVCGSEMGILKKHWIIHCWTYVPIYEHTFHCSYGQLCFKEQKEILFVFCLNYDWIIPLFLITDVRRNDRNPFSPFLEHFI